MKRTTEVLSSAGIEPTFPRMLLGLDDHYTIEATTLATWPIIKLSRILRRLFHGTFFFPEVFVYTHDRWLIFRPFRKAPKCSVSMFVFIKHVTFFSCLFWRRQDNEVIIIIIIIFFFFTFWLHNDNGALPISWLFVKEKSLIKHLRFRAPLSLQW